MKSQTPTVSGYAEGAPLPLLSEYEEKGPYHCEDCIFVTAVKSRKGSGECDEQHVMADVASGAWEKAGYKKGEEGRGEVNLQRGCCRWVKYHRDDN